MRPRYALQGRALAAISKKTVQVLQSYLCLFGLLETAVIFPFE